VTPEFDKIHHRFKLNNTHFNHNELKEVAYSYAKEGQPYEQVLGDFLIDWLNDRVYIEVKTSGSTGRPKTIKLQKQAMVNSAIATGDFFKLQPGDRALHCLPTNFIAGKMMLVRAMILGLEIDIVEPSSQPVFDYEVPYDFCAMIPLQLAKTHTYINNIKMLITGGASVNSHLKDKIKSIKTCVFETYGMTETVTHVAVKPINNAALLQERLTKSSGNSYFKTLPNVTISKDKLDCLIIEAPGLSKSIIVTNDVVKLHSKTEFEWLGRYDHVINSGGLKLYPEQIETKLEPYIEPRFFIASQEDPLLGDKVILVIEGDAFNINSEVFKALQKHEVPKNIYFVAAFIETPSRKLQRQQTLKILQG
jgi:O-succinylbenzoic acid--CoA ligase